MIVARNPVQEKIKRLQARLKSIQKVISELNKIYEETLDELGKLNHGKSEN